MARRIRTDVEGLRAVAVLMVLLYHLRLPGLGGGFAGVDVFFVISGFLITGLLLREGLATGRVDLPRFYARRARRLLPAALLVIVVTLLVGWRVLPGSQLRDLAHDSLGATFYVVNWVLAGRAVDYLAEDAGTSPLQHYWSLSIEEQFYVVWPVLVLLVVALATRHRLRLRPLLFLVLGTVVLASFAWSAWLTTAEPARAYFVSTTRVWELGVGALLAIAVPALARLPRGAAELLALGGLALILSGALLQDQATPWPGTAAVVPVLGSAAVLAAGCATDRTVGGRLLSRAPMVWLGGLSYAIYLWHWPLVVLAEARWGRLDGFALAGLGVLSIVLAWVTKHLVEDPIRYHRGLSARSWRALAAGGTTMAVVGTLALGLLASRPTLDESTPDLAGAAAQPREAEAPATGQTPDDRPPAPTPSGLLGPAALVSDAGAVPWTLLEDPSTAYTEHGPLVPHPDLATQDSPSYYDDGCQIDRGVPEPRHDCLYGDPEGQDQVLLLGDSKMGQWFSSARWIAEQEGWRLSLYLKSACPFTVAGAEHEDCSQFGQQVVEHLEQQEEAPALALVSMGAGATPELEAGVVEAVTRLQGLGTTVVIVQDNDHPPGSQYSCAAEHLDDLTACTFEVGGGGGHTLLTKVATATGAPVLDLRDWICPGGASCPVAIGGVLIWRQGSHLTDTYIRGLAPFLYRGLADLGVTSTRPEQITLADVPARTS